MTNKIYVNGKELRETWNAFLQAGAYAEFLCSGKMKDFVENDFRGEHGRQVLVSEPKVDAREFAVNIVVHGESEAALLANYNSLLSELEKGAVVIRIPDLQSTYRCIFRNATKLRNFSMRALTMSVTLYEPNPKNRQEEDENQHLSQE